MTHGAQMQLADRCTALMERIVAQEQERVYAGFVKESRRMRLGCGCEGAFAPDRMIVLVYGAGDACARHRSDKFFTPVTVLKSDLVTLLPYVDERKIHG